MRPRALLLALASKYVYSPLVGLTRTVAPSGTTADYAYDSANRLVSVRRNGTEIQAVSYRIGQDADNRVTVSDVICGNSKHVRLSQFDGLGRLIKTTDSSTGVSVSRKYDAMGRLYGEATYGLLDDLTFSYPSGSSQLESVTSAAEGTDFYGRVGFPLSGSQNTWNDTGLMASDSGFGITAITYNDFGLPVKFHTQDRKAYTAYSYSADGALLQKEVSTSTSSPFPFTSKSETTYSAGRIFYSATRSDPLGTYVSYFPGGYFDSNGGVHYIHRDYQGSVVMETDSTGHIEKHRGYYPYGEPWAESTNKKTLAASVAQPQTYQSKERTAATGDYDFGPRRYISAAPFWRAPDPKAHDYPNISPYAFCAANPVRYADPTGMDLFYMNREGLLIYRVLLDNYDQIIIKNGENDYVKSNRYDDGTITEVGFDGKVLGQNNFDEEKPYTRLKINDNYAASELFEFLADNITYNTQIEFSLLSGYDAEGFDVSYISSSLEKCAERAVKKIFTYTFKTNVYTDFIHSHPLSNEFSEDDVVLFTEIVQKFQNRNRPIPAMGIYYCGNKDKPRRSNTKKYRQWTRP